MLLLVIDLFIVTALSIAVILVLKRVFTMNAEDKLNAALEEQERSAKLAAQAAKVNPEEINNNKAKVQDVLGKIQE